MSKIIISVQIVTLFGVFLFVQFLAPSLQYPGNNAVLNGSIVDLKFRNANAILIDNNPDFVSAREIKISELNATRVEFKPGVYYWKAFGLFESSMRKFTINSEVGLELKNSSLINSGNVPLSLSIENESGTSELAILEVQIEYPVNENNKTIYRGEQHGK